MGVADFAVLYKFGVAVLFGLSPIEEDEILTTIDARVIGPAAQRDDESLVLEISSEGEDKVTPSGALATKDLSAARLLVVADALAKSVALVRDERRVNAVFDTIEPFAAELASKGRPPWRPRAMLELIGSCNTAFRAASRSRKSLTSPLGPARAGAALCAARG